MHRNFVEARISVTGHKARNFPKSWSLYMRRARNFFESRGAPHFFINYCPHTSSDCFILLQISTHFFIFSTYFDMFHAPLGNIRICKYTPSNPPDDVTFEKMSGGLGKISSPGPKG